MPIALWFEHRVPAIGALGTVTLDVLYCTYSMLILVPNFIVLFSTGVGECLRFRQPEQLLFDSLELRKWRWGANILDGVTARASRSTNNLPT